MTKGQQSFFQTNNVASWSTPRNNIKSNKNGVKIKYEESDEEYVDYAPTTKGKGRRAANATPSTSQVINASSIRNQASNKKGILHNKVTAGRVTKATTTSRNNITTRNNGPSTMTLPLRPLAPRPAPAYNNTPHYGPPRTNTQVASSARPPTRPRAPRAPITPQFDADGNYIPQPNVRWNEPLEMCTLFAVLQAVNSDPAIDTQRFFRNVGNIMTSDPSRAVTGSAIIQHLTKMRNLRRAAATPYLGGDTIADLVDYSQKHQRGKLTIGVYSKKDLGVAAAPPAPVFAVAGQPMATTSQVEEDGDDEEEEEVKEEFEECGGSAVDYLSPTEWVAAAIPEQTMFEMDPFWATQNQAAGMAALPWSWTPPVSSSAGSYDPQHYAWGFSPEQELAWVAEVQGGLPTNQDFSFTGFE